MQQRLPIRLHKANFGSPGDSNEETEEDAPAATPSASDPKDNNPEVPSSSTSLDDQIHKLTTLFDAYWDESQEHQVAMSQDMDTIRAKMTTIRTIQDLITQQLAQLLSLHTPPPPLPP